MIEKVNPKHPDKVADRIAGAIVDLAYTKQEKFIADKYYAFDKSYYKYADINGDNKDELLWIDNDTGYYRVYVFRNNKRKCIKKFDYARGENI